MQGKLALTEDGQEITDDIVKKTMKDIENHEPKYYKMLEEDPIRMKSITDAAKQVAEEHVEIHAEHSAQNHPSTKNILEAHLSEERIFLLKNSLSIPTFRLEISQNRDNKKHTQDLPTTMTVCGNQEH